LASGAVVFSTVVFPFVVGGGDEFVAGGSGISGGGMFIRRRTHSPCTCVGGTAEGVDGGVVVVVVVAVVDAVVLEVF